MAPFRAGTGTGGSDRRWLVPYVGQVLDAGCGAGSEIVALTASGTTGVGIDISVKALLLAAKKRGASLAAADATLLPFRDRCFDAALDRGCFHYLSAEQRPIHARQLARVLRPRAPFLLRARLTSGGLPNGLNASVVTAVFADWALDNLGERDIPSDSRKMPALVCRLRAPGE